MPIGRPFSPRLEQQLITHKYRREFSVDSCGDFFNLGRAGKMGKIAINEDAWDRLAENSEG